MCTMLDCVRFTRLREYNNAVFSWWVELAREYSSQWPNLTRLKPAPSDADQWKGVADKLKYFDPTPGKP